MDKLPILKVNGPDGHSQEFQLQGEEYSVGRDDGNKRPTHLVVLNDPLLSRHHFDIKWEGEKLNVQRSRRAKNPIFFGGKECDNFSIAPGQLFVSGETRFLLQLSSSGSSQIPTTEFTLSRTEFHNIHRPNINECFKALTEMLPELRTCTTRESAFQEALNVLKGLVPEASEFAILRVGSEEHVEMLCQRLSAGRSVSTPPSRRLLNRAFELSSTVTHVWAKAEDTASSAMMTEHAKADWAMASPIEVAGVEKFGLYVIGSAHSALDESEAKTQKKYLDGLASLVDIVAATLEHHLSVARFNRFEGQVVRFFSPALRHSLTGQRFENILRPRRRRVTVLFFDLRGFSKATEKAQADLDRILKHHSVLTEVMTAVTNCVFEEDGVVIDYQGDAVMACWGALSDDCEATKAVRAARAIVEKIYSLELPFGSEGSNAMRCGLGIATGDVIAGQVGAQEQTKFGVLGPTVNLASRLEGLTKYFGVPIVMNSDTREELGKDVLCRRIGLVRPAGLRESAELYELVLNEELGGSGLSLEEIACFETASFRYAEGKMEEAYKALMAGSRATDPIARFLTRHIFDNLDYGLPDDFDGVLSFRSK
jgi:adenylate cyclase